MTVVDGSGDTVYQVHVERSRVLPEATAFQMVTMLQDVVNRGTGSAARARGVRGVIGGKTGTTNDSRDAWFVGFSSAVVAGVWVGFDQPESIRDGASGARVALPDLGRLHAPHRPPAAVSRDSSSRPGCSASRCAGCPITAPCEGCDTYVEYFKEGDDVPSALCPIHPGSLKQEAKRVIQGLLGAIFRGFGGGDR